MPIFIAISSIFLLAALAQLANRVLSFRICPICAGVSGTWFWMLAGMFLEILPVASYQLPVAILMGGSVVGVAYQAEKKLLARRSSRPFPTGTVGRVSEDWPRSKPSLLWKALFIPSGFVTAYWTVLFKWYALVALAVSLIIAAGFSVFNKTVKENGAEKVKEIEKQLENCC